MLLSKGCYDRFIKLGSFRRCMFNNNKIEQNKSINYLIENLGRGYKLYVDFSGNSRTYDLLLHDVENGLSTGYCGKNFYTIVLEKEKYEIQGIYNPYPSAHKNLPIPKNLRKLITCMVEDKCWIRDNIGAIVPPLRIHNTRYGYTRYGKK